MKATREVTAAIFATQQVLNWIRKDEDGCFSETRFDNLMGGAGATFAWLKNQGKNQPGLETVAREAAFLHLDWINLLAIITKLNWMQEVENGGLLDSAALSMFASTDIDMFHVEMRSAFDHLGGIVSALSQKPKQVPSTSFHDLVTWCSANEYRADFLLGKDLKASIVDAEPWFRYTKELREEIIHRGGFTIVFPMTDHILFQVHSKGRPLVIQKLLMYNENVGDFGMHAALYLSRFWCLAEDIARTCFERMSLKQLGFGEGTMAYHPGLFVLSEWGTRLVTKANKLRSSELDVS